MLPHKQIPFGDLPIGSGFWCYGYQFLNYDHPKRCLCTKLGEGVAEELHGVRFQIDPKDTVYNFKPDEKTD